MGRHSNGQKNYQIAPSFIWSIFAIVVLIALCAVWWVATRQPGSAENAQGECIQGELTLPVAASSKELAQVAIQRYNAKQPVVRDHCVTATYSENLQDAAVYIAAESDATINQRLQDAGMFPATLQWPVIAVQVVGIAYPNAKADDATEYTDIAYPMRSDALTASTIAAQLAKPENQEALNPIAEYLRTQKELTIEQLAKGDKPFAVAQEDTPSGWQYRALESAQLPVFAVPMSPEADADEELIRAAADFGAKLQEDSGAAIPESHWKVAELLAMTDSQVPAHSDSNAAADVATGAAAHTLFVLDTSNNMQNPGGAEQTWFDASTQALAAVAPTIPAEYAQGLWNYSSPLTPGVQLGYRENLALQVGTDGDTVASVAQGFGTGGQPQTMQALQAALQHATAFAQETQQPVRIVLLTTGVADGGEIDAATIQAAKDAKVSVSLLHLAVDDTALPSELTKAVEETGGEVQKVGSAANLQQNLKSAVRAS